jgi:membrane fusion protein (multidrug efflux system)
MYNSEKEHTAGLYLIWNVFGAAMPQYTGSGQPGSQKKIAMSMLNKRAIIGTVAVAVVATAIVIIVLRPKHHLGNLPVVSVDTVRTRNVEIYGEFPGRIRAQQFVEVRARVEGYLEKMMFEEGTYVKKDQILFIIDPKQYKAQVDRAEALVTKNKAMALKAERDLARIRPLFEQKASSQLDLDNAVAAYESAKADVQLSEARTKENFSVVNLYKALGGGWKDF